MTVTVSTRPLFLNANTNVYTAWDLRSSEDGTPAGAGAGGATSFPVLQRAAGANMSVDVGLAGVGTMRAWVRGTTRGGMGMWVVDNIDRTAPTADTYLGTPFNDTVTANASGNPRLDMVILEVLDAQHAGASSLAQIRVVAGTPNAGATLDTRTGAAALPANSLLLADIIVANGAATIVTANIRDRRAMALMGSSSVLLNTLDVVSPAPHSGLVVASGTIPLAATGLQYAYRAFIGQRIVNATRIRWKYSHGPTAATGNYNIGIYDDSGRQIITTGSIAFTGALNTVVPRQDTIAATTFEPGWYFVAMGNTVASAAASIFGPQLSGAIGAAYPSTPGIAYLAASGGITLPATLSTSFSDVGPLTTYVTSSMPIICLTVG